MLDGMLCFMRGNPDVSLATPRTLNTDGTVQESARNLPSVMSGLFGRQSLLTEWFPNTPFSRRYLARDQWDNSQPFQVEQISAACMLFHRKLLEEVGLWDERYPGYWVDTDWCAHIIADKKKIYCVPRYELTHHENNAKGKPKSVRRIWMFHYGAYRLYSKWYCWGIYDPRSIAAGLLLAARAFLLMLINVKNVCVNHDSTKKILSFLGRRN
jgi:GT2 family glycosyltransferase